MTYSLTWLPDVLNDAGLHVTEVPGWKTRGHGDMGKPVGVICHHIAGAGPKAGSMPYQDLHTVTYGRPDLSGPLCNLALSRDGVFYMVAAGRAYHAGVGSYRGIHDGNRKFVGIEAAQTGYVSGPTGELWDSREIESYAKGCAAILDYLKQPTAMCIGHKEWAPHRKTDPTFNMEQFRGVVALYQDNPRGTWTGTIDRMAARLSPPRQCHDGCEEHVMGQKS